MKPRYRQFNGEWVKVNTVTYPRSWDAAETDRLTSTWTKNNKSIDYEIRQDLRTLQARAQEAYQNNDHVKRFVGLCKSNVIGPDGIKLQAKSTNTRGELDTRINSAVEAQWARWGRVGSCDVTGKLSWLDIQNLAMVGLGTMGEVLIRSYSPWSRNSYGFALQMIDPRRLDPRTNDEARNITMGVQRDDYGRPINYYLGETPTMSGGNFDEGRYDIIPASQITHLYLPEFMTQTRGVPLISAALYRLQMLKGYEEAELVAARVSASKLGFFEFDGTSGVPFQGDDMDASGNQIATTEPGEFTQLPPGVKANMIDPKHPTDAFGDFVKSALRGVAAGLGVSYNALASDLEGVNFSSLRQGALEERETWKCLQRFMVDHFCREVYVKWLEASLMSGVLPKPPQFSVEDQIEKLSAVEWQPRRWEWVDPLKNEQAAQLAIALGSKSLSQKIREEGNDPDDVFAEIALDKEKLSALGIELNPAEPESTEDEEIAREKYVETVRAIFAEG